MALSTWIARRADFAPDKPALRCDGETLTYADLRARIAGAVAGLQARGIGAGDRVAFLGLNSPELLITFFACARIGALFVPLNWRLVAPEIATILGDCQPSLLIADDAFQEIASAAAPTGLAVLGFGDIASDQAASGGAAPGGAPLLIVYTSGTTGRPKGAVLTQDALFWNAVNSTHMHDLTSADHVLTTAPMFHVGGLTIQTLPALHVGATVTLHRRFEAGATLAGIAADRPTLTVAVPAQMLALVEHPDWAGTDLSSLRSLTTGATIVPTGLIERFHARDVPVVQVYGTTETGPIAIYLRTEQARAHVGSAGKPAVHCDIRVVDESGGDVAGDTPGEILVRGPNVMQGYWRDPQATRAALADGWFRTGDIGHRDGQGYFHIDDRKKDVIIAGGENIYPAELEMILAECPDIAEAAVVGRPHERWGEVPVAVIVPRAGRTLDETRVAALFDGRLARFKHPRAVVFVDRLPRNAMGKIQKHTLRQTIRVPTP